MENLTLATLLAGRVCHDLAGTLGAVDGSAELLADTDDEALRRECADLLRTSVARMTARLRLYRAAFGGALPATSSAAAELIERASADVRVSWDEGAVEPSLMQALLCCGLIAADALPRGGRVDIESQPTLRVRLAGARVALDPIAIDVLGGAEASRPREAAAAMAARILDSIGKRLQVINGGGAAEIRAT